MLTNEFDLKDYKEEAYSLVTEQFRDKDVFKRYLDLLLSASTEIQLVAKDLMQNRSIDTARGKQLDMIGAIVGQPRTLINVDLFDFFGFFGNPRADSYGDINIPSVGSVWLDVNGATSGNVVLDDNVYRMLIKAKISKNITKATPEDIMRVTDFIFNADGTTTVIEGRAEYTLLIGKRLTKVEIGLLNWVNSDAKYTTTLLPKPVGVRINYGSFDKDRVFAFFGVPRAQGYGDSSYPYNGDMLYDGEWYPEPVPVPDKGGYWASLL